jgi:hypothetical protein
VTDYQSIDRIKRKLQQPGLIIVEEVPNTTERARKLLELKRAAVAGGMHFIQIAADASACPVLPEDRNG